MSNKLLSGRAARPISGRLADAAKRKSGAPVAYQISPLEDPRWAEFVQSHPRSSVFHTMEWLKALQRTYGYEPTVFTTSLPGAELDNGIVACRVKSWITGRRLVSLPFSDHCEPLVDDPADLQSIFSSLEQKVGRDRLSFVEMRPLGTLVVTAFSSPSEHTYCYHQLDLRPDLDTLFSRCHKGSTQRKILRAEREKLTYEDGRSEYLLGEFHRLLVITRRRHQIPPQPLDWFRALIDNFGEALKIRVAFRDRQAVAAILTLRHKATVFYKYGCSDAKFHNLGGMHLLFWKTIQEAKREGLQVLDFGRSDWESSGLITFKDRWGCRRSSLTYKRYSLSNNSASQYEVGSGWKMKVARRILAHLPERALCSVGESIYKHLG